MALKIERKHDNRTIKAILHRIADIPGGVTVQTSDLADNVILEGTPIGQHENGMYKVIKTATVLQTSTNNVYEITKNNHFKVGDFIGYSDKSFAEIESIDKSNPDKDIVTTDKPITIITKGVCLFEHYGKDTVGLICKPVAIVGSTYDVVEGENLFVDAWVIAVVRRCNAPIVNKLIENELRGIHYID